MGAKRHLNGTSREGTDRQTHRHSDFCPIYHDKRGMGVEGLANVTKDDKTWRGGGQRSL